MADRLGHRRAFLTGSALFTVASGACGLAPSVALLIVARVFQGMGAAILVPASLALVMAAFPRERLPQVVAIWGAIGALSAALGPSLGAFIIDVLGWRWAFFLNLPIGVLTIAAGSRALHESRDEGVRIPSMVGVVLIAAAAGALSYGVVESDSVGWASAQTALVLLAGAALLGLFVLHQRRTDSPTLDLELFALRNFRWGAIGVFCFGIGFSAMFFGLILYLVNVWEWSILRAGFAIAPGPALVGILAPRLGKLGGQIGQRPLLIAGGLLFAAGGLGYLLLLSSEVSYLTAFVLPLIPISIGTALVFPQATSVAAQALPANRTGVGGATVQAVRQFGASFGVALTIALLGTATGLDEQLAGYDRVFWLLVVTGGLTALAAVPLRTARATT
ncbi:MAG: MFS transporter [Actinomycetota bacterium]